jgi:uncharacterized protein (TIGR00730 family)
MEGIALPSSDCHSVDFDRSPASAVPRGDQSRRFPDARRDLQVWNRAPETPQALSPSYRLAFADSDFLARDELRPLRLQLELLKAEMALAERGIVSTVAMFGSARIPDPDAPASPRGTAKALAYCYAQAREFARLVTLKSLASGCREDVICTGGGPGIMEAGNRGAADAGGVSISLNVVLPFEQTPNPHVTPEFSFNFHSFAIRKMHFLMRAKAVVAFPGGFGTLDEVFEVLTLVQTGRMRPLPILLFGESFWRGLVNWEAFAEAGTIARRDLDLFACVDSAADAVARIEAWYGEPSGHGAAATDRAEAAIA